MYVNSRENVDNVFTHTSNDIAAKTIRAAAYQCSATHRLKVARLSSDNKSFLKVANGPLGST